MNETPTQKTERTLLVILFSAALLLHVGFATRNWKASFLPGHEFRQTQTALISYYIDQDDNFSVRYETPLVGKPWVAFPLEFPLYEWGVVGLSRVTGLPHFEAARTVSLTCFYLMLPAVYLLLGQTGMVRSRRLLTLALILTCPVYIFYSRAFLMESMVLMFSAWFLLAFVRTMRERRLHWVGLSALCGTAAGLIKSTTFFVWLLPAALYGAWCLWRDIQARSGWKPLLVTLGCGLAAVAGPGAAVYWWVKFTDAIKSTHASAYIFTSHNLTAGNFGMFDLAARFSPSLWRNLLERWHEAIMAPWVVGVFVLGGATFIRGSRWPVLAAAGLFLAAQALFPLAYAGQEYYFYACTVFLLGSLGFVLSGLLDRARPRWLAWLLIPVLFVAQLGNYLRGYFIIQSVPANGGSGLTAALNAYTLKGSVIIIAGADWSAIIPYYAQRRALMIRNGLEHDTKYIERAFQDLKDEDVGALVLTGNQRDNQELVRLAASRFHLDDKVTFSHTTADVYVNNNIRQSTLLRLSGNHGYEHITSGASLTDTAPHLGQPVVLSPALAANAFGLVSPAPTQYRFLYGITLADDDGTPVIGAHPDSELWVPVPRGAHRITWSYGLATAAYERKGDRTNGVEFIVAGEAPDGRRREIYHHLLDPEHVPSDRGRQNIIISYQPVADETLVFMTRPHNNDYSYDWAYWAGIKVE